MAPRIVAVIPCRFGASRFPGKPIADINGKPMLWHVYQQTIAAEGIDAATIATDDDRIRKVCEVLDLPVLMTRSDHVSGTDRVAECAVRLDADIIVNVQGDEPMIEPEAIARVARGIATCDDRNVQASNGYNEISSPSDAIDTNVVKVVMTVSGLAMAYSRLPIPYPKGGAVRHLRQLGLYAFRREGLERFAALKPGPLEQAEGVEMLRFVEHGYGVQMVQVPNDEGIPVDTPADLDRVRALMAGH
ncbi:3-deoxy-manno-octulosonate cytidylyltransferase [Aurantimonas aggregata]|uniref:3-deoxy-manno-octulosonate cytidylyltransferase n=1 Tax=Aurantimonas aggregata TaxID=2047720 RepID=A0A6L9MKH6_9HYPH|nr:3-deoxy-manno-octulosonate cytidylyltransferase [Aurantimonas aggregata]NDV88058.1 3-deoxy-manno-octulosonate cytidylyltransferase [Aurantimonas aggregata]